MSHPALGLAMLGLIVAAIMMGFPTAFTLMGLGMIFGYIAFFDPSAGLLDNRVFDLVVQRAFWGIASGIVGAVVVLMGVIAMRPMMKAGYDVRLASGVITAGGTLGILIPPSVMIIVYAAVTAQSVVKLYAAAMVPGFFLTFLYLIYIIGWALIDPKIAPRLPEEQTRVPVPG